MLDFIEVKLDKDISKIEELSSRNKRNIKVARNGVIELRKKVYDLKEKNDVSLGTEDMRFFKRIIFPENEKRTESDVISRRDYTPIDIGESPFDQKLKIRKSQRFYTYTVNKKNRLSELRPEQYKQKIKGRNMISAENIGKLKLMRELEASKSNNTSFLRDSSVGKSRTMKINLREIKRKQADGTFIDTERYYQNLVLI